MTGPKAEQDAPVDFELTRALLNSAAPARLRSGPDVLAEVATAEPWLRAIAGGWAGARGVEAPPIILNLRALARLRMLREGLLERVHHSDPKVPGLVAAVSVTVSLAGVAVAPAGEGVDWIASALATETLVSSRDGSLARLKVCHNPQCGMSFVDASRNNSRVWHDTATCGNAANVRSFRERAKG